MIYLSEKVCVLPPIIAVEKWYQVNLSPISTSSGIEEFVF